MSYITNAFLKGLEKLGADVSDAIIAVYYFFNGWPARCEDYEKIQNEENVPKHKFIKHVTSRWLTLGKAPERLLVQLKALRKYFVKYIPQKQDSLMSTANYAKIVSYLRRPSFKAEIQFVIDTANIFSRFTGFFQREEPLIHILHDEIYALALKLISRSCIPEILKSKKLLEEPATKVFEAANLLTKREVVISDEVKTYLAELPEKEQLQFLAGAQQHYIASCQHILKKTPLQRTPILKHFRFLHPCEKTKNRSSHDIVVVARSLPFDKPVKTDVLLDEWRLLQLETSVPCPKDKKMRVDHYWRQFLNLKHSNGDEKFPNVMKVVKASLVLSHGSSDVERGFSKSACILTEEKSRMSVRMLNTRRIVSDGMKNYDNRPELVTITRELLALARNAHSSYRTHLELEKKAQEKLKQEKTKDMERLRKEDDIRRGLENEKEKILKLEEDLRKARKEHVQKRETSEKLLKEANKKLQNGLQKNDLSEIRVAQVLFQSMEAVNQEEGASMKQHANIETYLNKRKLSFIGKRKKLLKKDKLKFFYIR